jgi:hypothetical protein
VIVHHDDFKGLQSLVFERIDQNREVFSSFLAGMMMDTSDEALFGLPRISWDWESSIENKTEKPEKEKSVRHDRIHEVPA